MWRETSKLTFFLSIEQREFQGGGVRERCRI